MNKVNVCPFIDRYHPNKDGKCPVSIRLTHLRKRRYYPTSVRITPTEFDKITTGKRLNSERTEILRTIEAYSARANQIIKELPIFTFEKFEDSYYSNRDSINSISIAFDKRIKELKYQERLGTAASYESAKGSIESFKNGLDFADITPKLLAKYETWMLNKGKSKTTIGIYLRSLRALFNGSDIDKSIYPFGTGRGKYTIPSSKNIKKALTLMDIGKIYDYQGEKGSPESMARDYWIFFYLCNGLNVKDFCLLKQKNIVGEILKYERAKTKRSKKDSEDIVISLKPEAKAIIRRWGATNIYPEAYLFPHLNDKMTAAKQRAVIQQVTRKVNKYIKRVAIEVGIKMHVTSYSARHSFATVLRNSGVSTEFISGALGHSNLLTTQSYLAGFEEEKIHKATDALINFEPSKKEAN